MEISEASYQIIAELLAARTGQQLTEGRRWRIGTSLSSIFRERGITNVDQLVCLLTMPGETQLVQDVVEALLNNETYFFRDKPTFDQLPAEIFPILAERRSAKRRLQIWCAGCSTGQEAHSLAIQFAEQAAQWEGWSIDILGTDISQKAISVARSGHYSQFEVQRGLSVSQMLNYFDETASGWQMHSSTRSIVRFQQHNILDPAPCRQPFDLILCRNVLLYFDGPTRTQAFDRLHQALAPDGFLMLGAGETVVGQTQMFESAARRPSIYEPVSAMRSVQQALAG
ncbi:protein-glutamate O-methyltransferase CheR [Altererythrobacter arenosus]|uniref:protein-glutamate O-methyltransferase n=1 Tax=Altererythrobacter arenosus TaxID=3032592 RepID=A0ABY8FTM0_9SPHN|nr:protein-glutamate O-methyltransferase CheR [Altererythrobacter sp. CAU 1644]WFL78182.1 protein-glutamate O-methyltransferase CheR [Altererythrobacter sp. CAU 1644]